MLLDLNEFQRRLAEEPVEEPVEEPLSIETVQKTYSIFILELDREVARVEQLLEGIEVQFVRAQPLLMAKNIRISKFKNALLAARKTIQKFRDVLLKNRSKVASMGKEAEGYEFEVWHLGVATALIGAVMAALSPIRRAMARAFETLKSRWNNSDILKKVSRLRKEFETVSKVPLFYSKLFNDLEDQLPLRGHLDKKVIKEIEKVLKTSDDLRKHLRANGPMDQAFHLALKELTQIEKKLT